MVTVFPTFQSSQASTAKLYVALNDEKTTTYHSSSITIEVANKKFGENHSVVLHTLTISLFKFQLNPFAITEVINFFQNF